MRGSGPASRCPVRGAHSAPDELIGGAARGIESSQLVCPHTTFGPPSILVSFRSYLQPLPLPAPHRPGFIDRGGRGLCLEAHSRHRRARRLCSTDLVMGSERASMFFFKPCSCQRSADRLAPVVDSCIGNTGRPSCGRRTNIVD